MESTYLILQLVDEKFGINVENVIEAIEPGEITEVPNTAPYILGITNFRGNILTVIDLRTKFNMPITELNKAKVIIVLNYIINEKELTIGVVADSVKDVIEVSFADITDIPEIGTKYNTEFINGIVNKKNAFIVLLDIIKIFTADEITIISEAGANN